MSAKASMTAGFIGVSLAAAIAPGCRLETVGIRPGEKLHEVMVPEDDARNTLEFDEYFVIQPAFPWWASENAKGGRPCVPGFRYSSDANDRWLSADELRRMAGVQAG